MSGAIPVNAAKALGQKHNCPIIVIFAIEHSSHRYCVTTWGKTKHLCGWAAKVSEKIHQAVTNGKILDANHADNPYAEIDRLRKLCDSQQQRIKKLAAICEDWRSKLRQYSDSAHE